MTVLPETKKRIQQQKIDNSVHNLATDESIWKWPKAFSPREIEEIEALLMSLNIKR